MEEPHELPSIDEYRNKIQVDDEVIAKGKNFDRFEASLSCKTYRMHFFDRLKNRTPRINAAYGFYVR